MGNWRHSRVSQKRTDSNHFYLSFLHLSLQTAVERLNLNEPMRSSHTAPNPSQSSSGVHIKIKAKHTRWDEIFTLPNRLFSVGCTVRGAQPRNTKSRGAALSGVKLVCGCRPPTGPDATAWHGPSHGFKDGFRCALCLQTGAFSTSWGLILTLSGLLVTCCIHYCPVLCLGGHHKSTFIGYFLLLLLWLNLIINQIFQEETLNFTLGKPQTSAAVCLIQSLFLRPTFSSRGVSNNSCERQR